MSADNVIGIGQFPTKDGNKEYRVAEFRNMEGHSYTDHIPKEWTDLVVFLDYYDSPVYKTWEEANDAALEMLDNMDICEYGIGDFKYTFFYSLEMTKEEALEKIKKYWDKQRN